MRRLEGLLNLPIDAEATLFAGLTLLIGGYLFYIPARRIVEQQKQARRFYYVTLISIMQLSFYCRISDVYQACAI